MSDDHGPLLTNEEDGAYTDKTRHSIFNYKSFNLPDRSRSRLSRIRKAIVFSTIVVAFTLISFTTSLAAQLLVARHHWSTNTSVQKVTDYSVCKAGTEFNCGTTAAEARAMGCHFQLWSYSWVPHDCYDPELHKAFLRRQAEEGWGYFHDRNGLEEIPLDVILRGDTSKIFTTWGQHFWHCAYYQRNFFLAKVGITNRDRDLHHSLHCQKWMSNPFYHPWNTTNVNLTVGFHTCDSVHGLGVLDKTEDFIFHKPPGQVG